MALTDGGMNPEKAMKIPAVEACVTLLAQSVAGLPFNLMKRRTTGKGADKAIDHRLYEILHYEPNANMMAFTFWETLMGHLLLWGNAYIQIIRNKFGGILALNLLLPWEMKTSKNDKGGLIYEYNAKGGRKTLKPWEIMHIPAFGFDGLRGMSPIEMHMNTFRLSNKIETYSGTVFADNPSMYASVTGNLTEKQSKAMRDTLAEYRTGGKRAGKWPVLEGGTVLKNINTSPEQAQLLENRKEQDLAVARIFRVPPHKIGILDRATFSNIEHQGMEFVVYSLNPWLRRIEQAVRRSLLMDEEKRQYFSKFNVNALLRGDTESRYRAYNIARQGGWRSPNDILDLEDDNPISDDQGGNTYMVNGAMKPVKELIQRGVKQ